MLYFVQKAAKNTDACENPVTPDSYKVSVAFRRTKKAERDDRELLFQA